jgi:hypothetical protein
MKRHMLAALVAGLLVAADKPKEEGSKEKPIKAAGVVTLDGRPVANATVVFLPNAEAGSPAIGKTDAAGKCQLTTFHQGDGALPGDYAVLVIKRAKGKAVVPDSYGDPARTALKVTVAAERNDRLVFFKLELEGADSKLEGHLDIVGGEEIAGWAWDPKKPDTPVKVDVYDGDTLLATVVADQFREDLLKEKIGNGKHGFSIATPAKLKDGKGHTIRVLISGTKTELNDSPKTFKSKPAK